MREAQIVQRYIDAWNARDAQAILASLTPDGSYEDPTTGGPLSGEALRGHVERLWAAFPDLRFSLLGAPAQADARVTFEWRMQGTNHGSFAGLPPTNREVTLDGVDVARLGAGALESVKGYFDPGALQHQLGLQVLVQPDRVGPFGFGMSVHVASGRRDPPGALSLTHLHARSPEAARRVSDQSRAILGDMLRMEGFLGARNSAVGTSMVTLTAWTDAEAPRRLLREGAHVPAMQDFFAGELASAGFTSVWVPARMNPYWVRCEGCGRMNDPAKATSCACGAAVGAPPAYL